MTLICAYAFDEGAGTTAADSSGNGYNLTVSSGIWTSGHTSGAITPSATSPSSRSLGSGTLTSWTCMAWIRLDDSPGYQSIMQHGGPSEPEFLINGKLGLWNGSTVLAFSGSTVTQGVWHHVAVTVDATTVSVYVDGVLDDSDPVSGTTSLIRDDAWYLAGAKGSEDHALAGPVDDFRIFDSALSSTDITTWMNTPVGGGSTPTLPELVMAPRALRY